VKAGAHGSFRDPERGRHLHVAQVLPRNKNDDVAVALRKVRESSDEALANWFGVDPSVSGHRLVERVLPAPAEALECSQFAGALAPVPEQEIRGQPVEPGSSALVNRPEPAALLEGDPEHLAGELVGDITTRPPLEVAVDFFPRIAFANLDALYLAPKSHRIIVIGHDEFP